jgi:hypothetical protein
LSVFDSSMPLPNTSPDMSPQPTTVIGSLCTSTPISAKWRWTETQAPLGGDAHRLVVVADRCRREAKASPSQKAALERDRIGDVGEGRGALVGGDDEIGILAVEHAHALRDGPPCASTKLSVTDSSVRMKMR